MHDIWENDEQYVAIKWDEIYQNKYMEYIAKNGLGHESQLKGVGQAYEYACLEVMKLYNVTLARLDKILSLHSAVLNKKKPKEKSGKK